jgi:four helix bundle protein
MSRPAVAFQDLLVWQKSHALVLRVYEASGSFPRHELFGLTAQIRRAAMSVPSNIAEGFRRRGRLDKVRFINIAASSLEEVRYQLLLATDLRYLSDSRLLTEQAEEVSRMLSSYERTILASARMANVRTVVLTSVFCILYSVF